MKMLLMLLILTSATTVIAQEEFNDGTVDVIQEETIFPEESYEAEMFSQKQEEFSYPDLPVTDSVEEAMAESEVYESESDY